MFSVKWHAFSKISGGQTITYGKKKLLIENLHFKIYRVFHVFWFLTKRHKSASRKDKWILKKVPNRSWSADFILEISVFHM